MPRPDRAGRIVQQSTGYRAFVPAPLPAVAPTLFDPASPRLDVLGGASRHVQRGHHVEGALDDGAEREIRIIEGV